MYIILIFVCVHTDNMDTPLPYSESKHWGIADIHENIGGSRTKAELKKQRKVLVEVAHFLRNSAHFRSFSCGSYAPKPQLLLSLMAISLGAFYFTLAGTVLGLCTDITCEIQGEKMTNPR